MAEFKGSEFQIEIQKRMLTRHSWIKDNPEFANGGRVLNFLEPNVTGWDAIRKYLEEDGIVGLTAQPRATIKAEAFAVFGDGYDYPSWDVYYAPADVIADKCHAYLDSRALPKGWKIECFERPSDHIIEEVQSLNLETGVAPYAAFYTRGDVVPCMTACLWDEHGVLVATSSSNTRFHDSSRLAHYVFNGSISVKAERRGMSLGKLVNAHVMLESRDAMGWTHAITQVKPDNTASVKTVIASGFVHQNDLITLGIFTNGVVFTR
ncbi:MAG: hypothetical protein JKX69_07800 [Rhodobacteraceae bacterium]|nr:hypothetical protein [Paracoccaceae bacterium]